MNCLLDCMTAVWKDSLMVLKTKLRTKKQSLLVRLNKSQMEKLRQLEQRTPDTNLKNMLRALILLAQRTKQILAKRRSPRSRQQILGLKDILTKAGFSSRNTLYEWVKRFDPNNPSSIDDRKSRIPGATRAMIQSLQSDYARGKVKNYAQGLAWLKSHKLKTVSQATYYRWLSPVIKQTTAKTPSGYAGLMQVIRGDAQSTKPTVSQVASAKPTRQSDEARELHAMIERIIAKLEGYEKAYHAKFLAQNRYNKPINEAGGRKTKFFWLGHQR